MARRRVKRIMGSDPIKEKMRSNKQRRRGKEYPLDKNVKRKIASTYF